MELPENTGINEHTIELVEDKHHLYTSIYYLGLSELEMLKAYIKIHLKTGFIWPSKSPTGVPILFNKKPNSNSLSLYVNYQDFNNLTIKNWYPLPLICESLDRLGYAKWFT